MNRAQGQSRALWDQGEPLRLKTTQLEGRTQTGANFSNQQVLPQRRGDAEMETRNRNNEG